MFGRSGCGPSKQTSCDPHKKPRCADLSAVRNDGMLWQAVWILFWLVVVDGLEHFFYFVHILEIVTPTD